MIECNRLNWIREYLDVTPINLIYMFYNLESVFTSQSFTFANEFDPLIAFASVSWLEYLIEYRLNLKVTLQSTILTYNKIAQHGLRPPDEEIGRKSNLDPKFLDTAGAYFVCHIGPKF